MLLKQTTANKHNIKLEKNKQPHYWPIYSLRPIELKTFKTYIKTNLANNFIKACKLLVGTVIFFVCKTNNSIQFYINY